MFKLYTHVTLDGSGHPATGVPFDLRIASLAGVESQNMQLFPLRTGGKVIGSDPSNNYPIEATLIMATGLIDVKDVGDVFHFYLGSSLVACSRTKVPIVIFTQSSQSSSKQALLCYIVQNDPALSGSALATPTQQCYLQQMEQHSASLSFGLHVALNGTFTDEDNIASGTWGIRPV